MDTIATVLADAAPGAIASLCGRFHVRQLDLFGSAANDCFDPLRSDLDFLVAFEAMPAAACARAYFGLRDALVALFGHEVDLVTEPALQNPYLRASIEARRVRLFPTA